MAFSWAGDLTGAKPIVRNFQVGADCYEGQLLIADFAVSGGHVLPVATAAAGPDITQKIIGICTGVVTSPTYNNTYRGNKCTYDTTNAALQANDPVGAAMVQVTRITPTTLIKAPVVKDIVGTAPERKACTVGSAGLTFVVATIDTSISSFSTAYCSKGANRGESRIITTGGVATQTVVISFTNTIAIGNEFVIANIRNGFARINWDTQFQGIDSSHALGTFFLAYVHELNLEEAGKEYAVFTLNASHLA